MSTELRKPERRIPGAYMAGLILIVVGAVGMAASVWGGGGQVIVLAVGAAFLAVYAWNRAYGFLVPGGVLTGLGGGLVAGVAMGGGESVLVPAGLGTGFLLIYALDLLVTNSPERWWPLIPGGVLLVGGTVAGTDNADVHRAAALWSPGVLVLFGVLLLLTQIWRRGAPRGGQR